MQTTTYTMHKYRDDSKMTFVQTPAGVVIGRAYVPPPQFPGSEAIKIQRGLLAKPRRFRLTIDDCVGFICLIGLVATFAFGGFR